MRGNCPGLEKLAALKTRHDGTPITSGFFVRAREDSAVARPCRRVPPLCSRIHRDVDRKHRDVNESFIFGVLADGAAVTPAANVRGASF